MAAAERTKIVVDQSDLDDDWVPVDDFGAQTSGRTTQAGSWPGSDDEFDSASPPLLLQPHGVLPRQHSAVSLYSHGSSTSTPPHYYGTCPLHPHHWTFEGMSIYRGPSPDTDSPILVSEYDWNPEADLPPTPPTLEHFNQALTARLACHALAMPCEDTPQGGMAKEEGGEVAVGEEEERMEEKDTREAVYRTVIIPDVSDQSCASSGMTSSQSSSGAGAESVYSVQSYGVMAASGVAEAAAMADCQTSRGLGAAVDSSQCSAYLYGGSILSGRLTSGVFSLRTSWGQQKETPHQPPAQSPAPCARAQPTRRQSGCLSTRSVPHVRGCHLFAVDVEDTPAAPHPKKGSAMRAQRVTTVASELLVSHLITLALGICLGGRLACASM